MVNAINKFEKYSNMALEIREIEMVDVILFLNKSFKDNEDEKYKNIFNAMLSQSMLLV